MKKIYMSPETCIVLLSVQKMIAASPDGFNKNLDNDDPITDPNDLLSRRGRHRDVWDDEGEEEEY